MIKVERIELKGFTLVVPFFNEAEVFQDTLTRLWSFLKTQNRPFELILGDDGSTDASTSMAEEFVRLHPEQVQLIKNETNSGRGSILSKAFAQATMPVVMYVDADLEIEIPYVEEMIRTFDDEKVKLCTGTKLSTSQHKMIERQRHRKLASIVLNSLIHLLLHSKLSDHQCGLKGFRKDVIAQILPNVQEKGWAWDTEVLLLAQKMNFKVYEFPVQLASKRKSTVPLFSTIALFLRKLMEFRRRGLGL